MQADVRNRIESYRISMIKAAPRLMYVVTKVYRDITHAETVEFPEEISNVTFIGHLTLATGETSR